MTSLLPAPLAVLALMAPSANNGLTGQIFMIAMMVGIFYFIVLAPQQKQRKQQEESLRQLKRGDEIVTAGGIVGEVIHIAIKDGGKKDKDGKTEPSMDDRITIKSAESRLVVERGRIARIVGKSADAASA
ncbi:MAG: preprotein translocase subunit YajC [Gemmatimonadaceae bacterium]